MSRKFCEKGLTGLSCPWELLFLLAVAALPLLPGGCSEDRPRRLRVGEVVAPFSARTLDNEDFRLEEYLGRPALVRFFLTDCSYCKVDTPIFNSFYEEHRNSGLIIVYLNTNASDIRQAEEFRRDFDVQFPMIYDKGAEIAIKYRIEFQPLTLVLSPEHRLLAALAGGVSREELDELLGPYFSKSADRGSVP